MVFLYIEAFYRSLDGFRLFYFYSLHKVTGSLAVCLYLWILLTAEPILFSYTQKLPIGPYMVLGFFIIIPYNKETLPFFMYVCLSVPKSLANC